MFCIVVIFDYICNAVGKNYYNYLIKNSYETIIFIATFCSA